GICTQLAANLPAFVLGFSFESIAAFVAFRGLWAIFVHSNVRLPLGPLRVLFGAPELHHWHHANVERTRHNFANLAPWLDVIFGRYHCAGGEERYALGLSDPWPKGYLSQLAHPFVLTYRSLVTRSGRARRSVLSLSSRDRARRENPGARSTRAPRRARAA